MNDLTDFQRDLLCVIAGMNEPYGLAVKAEIEDYHGTAVNPSRVYQGLDTLVAKGLVEKGQRDQRTNAYTLTQRGQRELNARQQWKKKQYSPKTADS